MEEMIIAYQKELESKGTGSGDINVKIEGGKVVAIHNTTDPPLKRSSSKSKKVFTNGKKKEKRSNNYNKPSLNQIEERESGSESSNNKKVININPVSFSESEDIMTHSDKNKPTFDNLRVPAESNIQNKKKNLKLMAPRTRAQSNVKNPWVMGKDDTNTQGSSSSVEKTSSSESTRQSKEFNRNDSRTGDQSVLIPPKSRTDDPFQRLESTTRRVNRRLSVRPGVLGASQGCYATNNTVRDRVKLIDGQGHQLRTLDDLVKSAIDRNKDSNSGDYTKNLNRKMAVLPVKKPEPDDCEKITNDPLGGQVSKEHEIDDGYGGIVTIELLNMSKQQSEMFRYIKTDSAHLENRHQEILTRLSIFGEDLDLSSKLNADSIKNEINFVRNTIELLPSKLNGLENVHESSNDPIIEQMRQLNEHMRDLKIDSDNRGKDMLNLGAQFISLKNSVSNVVAEMDNPNTTRQNTAKNEPLIGNVDVGSLATKNELKDVHDSIVGICDQLDGMKRREESRQAKKDYQRMVSINNKTKKDTPVLSKLDKLTGVMENLNRRVSSLESSVVRSVECKDSGPDTSLCGKIDKLSRNQLSLLNSLQTINSNIEQVGIGLEELREFLGLELEYDDQSDGEGEEELRDRA